MSTRKNEAADEARKDLSAEQVADYLARHPEFFTANGHLLAAMAAPGRWAEGVVDIQQVMLDRRLEEIEELRNCAVEVIETSRTNMTVQTRTHAAVLALLSAITFEQLLRVVQEDVPLLLDIDVALLAFEAGDRPLAELVASETRYLKTGAVDETIGADKEVRLIRDVRDDGTLFGAAAGLVRSAALVRLRPSRTTTAGLLALGSRGVTFHPGQGTELLQFLARALESCVQRWPGRQA
ncbi:MAG: DUF484 family protein [Rhodospirillales bacterium]|nr:DUF484 family protein [Rhodospirillales bacterium]MSP80159.1 DUF484 family protein [Rhodospirillales bacterium]